MSDEDLTDAWDMCRHDAAPVAKVGWFLIDCVWGLDLSGVLLLPDAPDLGSGLLVEKAAAVVVFVVVWMGAVCASMCLTVAAFGCPRARLNVSVTEHIGSVIQLPNLFFQLQVLAELRLEGAVSEKALSRRLKKLGLLRKVRAT